MHSQPTRSTGFDGQLQVIQIPLEFVVLEIIQPTQIRTWVDFGDAIDQLLLGEHGGLLCSCQR